MRKTAEKGSYLNFISRFLGGRALDVDFTNPFGADPYMEVQPTDPLLENIKGGKQLQDQELMIL